MEAGDAVLVCSGCVLCSLPVTTTTLTDHNRLRRWAQAETHPVTLTECHWGYFRVPIENRENEGNACQNRMSSQGKHSELLNMEIVP